MSHNLDFPFDLRDKDIYLIWLEHLDYLLTQQPFLDSDYWKKNLQTIGDELLLNLQLKRISDVEKFLDEWNQKTYPYYGFPLIYLNSLKTQIKAFVDQKEIYWQQLRPKNPRQLEILSGPVSFYFYHNLLGRRILLLGDRHNKDALCQQQIWRHFLN